MMIPRSQKHALVALIAVAMLSCQATPYREVEVNLAAIASERPPDPQSREAFRFSVAAMQSPRNTHAAYSHLFTRVGALLGVPVEFVQRRTYREVNDLLKEGRLDAALLCAGGYLDLRERAPSADVLAVPVIDGKTTYQAFVIVPASSPATSLMDLRGKRFAFSDELSSSGRAYVLHSLRKAHEEPVSFFSASIFTGGHDKSIEAVASGLVDGTTVASLVYQWSVAAEPELATSTRVIERSPPLGMPPIVAGPSLAPATRARLREVLLGIHRDPAAAAALRVTRIERFEAPAPGLYDSAAQLAEAGR